MNFKMQERFCQAHKASTAETTWQARSYPEVDWESLQERLESHNVHMQAVLDGRIRSRYRDELEEKIRKGNTKTAQKTFNPEEDNGSGPRVGYYGSRGAKMMYARVSYSRFQRSSGDSLGQTSSSLRPVFRVASPDTSMPF